MLTIKNLILYQILTIFPLSFFLSSVMSQINSSIPPNAVDQEPNLLCNCPNYSEYQIKGLLSPVLYFHEP